MTILDGKTLSEQILTSLKSEISDQKLSPTLDIILVGTDPASQKYVDMKQKVATDIGIGGQVHHLDQSASTAEVIDLINRLNQDKAVTGFMVQLPLPPQIDTQQVLSAIDPKKDADGLSPFNLGLIFQKQSTGIPAATALGITKILDHYHIDVSGKNAVIVGRSPDVAFPLFALLTARDATVTICHTQTKNLNNLCRQADILVSAIGKPKFFDKTFVKPGTVVIDVGFSRDQNGKLSGDFDFNSVKDIASFITPVPGGVGPMTIASLLFNTVQIAKISHENSTF
jgi:methylenetetrahydrofolate dehydrogenase (NADP+)/methenyltetrahydrofolate cyclohydrolase